MEVPSGLVYRAKQRSRAKVLALSTVYLSVCPSYTWASFHPSGQPAKQMRPAVAMNDMDFVQLIDSAPPGGGVVGLGTPEWEPLGYFMNERAIIGTIR